MTTGDPWEDQSRQRIWRNLVVAESVILRRVEHEIRETAGINLCQYDVLLRLHEAPSKSVSLETLCNRAVFTICDVAEIVAQLEGVGLVENVRVDSERTPATITLTEQGRYRLRLASDTHNETVDELFASLIDPRETGGLDAFFTRLVAKHVNDGQQCNLGPPPPGVSL